MSSSYRLLAVESRDFTHAEKEITACKAVQIHKMTSISTQNCPRLSFCESGSALQAFSSFSALEKSSDSTHNSQKLEDM